MWYFQELAARIGPERMQEYIDKIGYGNKDISGGLTTFWLGSSLQISRWSRSTCSTSYIRGNCRSQPRIPRFCKEHHSFRRRHQADGQTGSALRNEKWVSGWFVGCVNKDGRYYVFATNIEAADAPTAAKPGR